MYISQRKKGGGLEKAAGSGKERRRVGWARRREGRGLDVDAWYARACELTLAERIRLNGSLMGPMARPPWEDAGRGRGAGGCARGRGILKRCLETLFGAFKGAAWSLP